MATRVSITFKLSIAWWWYAYVGGVRTMAAMTGQQPDEAKVNYWAGKAMRLKVVK